MLKRPLSLVLATALACGATACKPKVDPAVAQAEAQKAFQDKQRLALIKVYDDLAKKYPESPNAAKAKERADVLRQQAGIQKTTAAKK
jgi:hypothetical protein